MRGNRAHFLQGRAAGPLGFTLLELLVVMAIIAVMASLLIPAMARTKAHARRTQCVNNLRQIGIASRCYVDDNRDTFYSGRGGDCNNGGEWMMGVGSEVLRNPVDATGRLDHGAYWALGYRNYFSVARKLFACPSTTIVDEWHDLGLWYPREYWLSSTYGMCRYLIMPYAHPSSQYGTSGIGPMRTSSLLSPMTTIFCQDAAEQNMEGEEDSLGLFPGRTTILDQWMTLAVFYNGVDMTAGWWRHNRGCNTLWVSGQVESH